jgi:hypothetical protein
MTKAQRGRLRAESQEKNTVVLNAAHLIAARLARLLEI